MPKRNQLTIIIDQIVLMQDQFEELYDENAGTFEASGYGFRLIEPLDEPRVVEVRVEHSANTQSYTQDLFSKVAAFISDGQLQIQSLNSKYHYLPEEYETGKCELELWLNGKRLLCGEDFFEARLNADGTKELVAQGDISSLSSLVYIDIPLSADDVVCFKITRFMSTYSNFNASLEPIKSRITEVDDYSKGHIVKLEILSDAKRSSATTRKCRCSAAKVLSITTLDGRDDGTQFISSGRDSNFVYRVGEIVRVDDFDENRWNECSTGIHFFITRDEAVKYGNR